MVFLDEAGAEVYAGPNTDLRAVFDGASIDDQLGDRVYSTTGHLPSFLFAPAKARWLREHRPDDFSRITSTVTLADWLALKLTGRLASEPALAGEAGLLDISSRTWCSALLSELDMLWSRLHAVRGSSLSAADLAPAETRLETVADRTSRPDLAPLHSALQQAGAVGWHPVVPLRVGLMECIAARLDK